MKRIVYVLEEKNLPKACVSIGKTCPMYWVCKSKDRRVPNGKIPEWCRLIEIDVDAKAEDEIMRMEDKCNVSQNLLSVPKIEKILARMQIKEVTYVLKESKSTNSIYITLKYKGESVLLRLSDHCGSNKRTIYIGKKTKETKIERSVINSIKYLKARHIQKYSI